MLKEATEVLEMVDTDKGNLSVEVAPVASRFFMNCHSEDSSFILDIFKCLEK